MLTIYPSNSDERKSTDSLSEECAVGWKGVLWVGRVYLGIANFLFQLLYMICFFFQNFPPHFLSSLSVLFGHGAVKVRWYLSQIRQLGLVLF